MLDAEQFRMLFLIYGVMAIFIHTSQLVSCTLGHSPPSPASLLFSFAHQELSVVRLSLSFVQVRPTAN
jgi:hypothetical protein